MAKPKKPAAKRAPAKQHSTTTSRAHRAAAASKRAGSSSARTSARGSAAIKKRKPASAKKPASGKKPASAKKPVPAKRSAPAKRNVPVKRPAVARKLAAPLTVLRTSVATKSAPSSKLLPRANHPTGGKSALLTKPAPSAKPSAPARPLGAAIDAYIKELGDWRVEAVTHICQIVAANAPRAKGVIRFGHPVYEQKGPFAYVKALPHIVHFGFWRGARLEDVDKVLVGEGDRMRHVKLWSAAEVREERFGVWIREAVRLNQELGDPTKNLA